MDYVLIPGAGGRAWYWHLLAPALAERGHRAIAVELPADDDTKGLSDYAQAVLDAADTAGEVVIVAASLGAFTAPLVSGHCRRPRWCWSTR
jgi:pimeloyl-ACP methyl ester carboxylesterase